jgi:hypothetical protein
MQAKSLLSNPEQLDPSNQMFDKDALAGKNRIFYFLLFG